MGRIIKLGKSNSKICATCEYWDGGTGFVTSKGYRNSPETMEVDNEAIKTLALCVKNMPEKMELIHAPITNFIIVWNDIYNW